MTNIHDVKKLREAFCRIVRRDLADDLEAILEKNRAYAEAGETGACATHDYCDANMLMEEAFIETFYREPDVSSNEDARLWSAAWNLACAQEFEETVR